MSNTLKMIVYSSVGLLAVFAWHFATVFGIVGSPPQSRAEFFIRFAIIMVVWFVSSGVAAVLIAKNDENDGSPDEREEQILFKVERNSVFVLYAGMLCLMWFVFTPMTPMQIANALLGIVFIAEAFKIVSGLQYLRSRR